MTPGTRAALALGARERTLRVAVGGALLLVAAGYGDEQLRSVLGN